MSDEIEAIKARLAAATPGPWMELAESGEWWIGRNCEDDPEQFGSFVCASDDMSDANIDFVTYAPDDIALLLARLAAAEQARDAARAEAAQLRALIQGIEDRIIADMERE